MSRFIVLMALVLLVPLRGAGAEEIRIAWLSQAKAAERASTVLDGPSPKDAGLAGLRLAMADNNAGGRFMGQSFRLMEMEPASLSSPLRILANEQQAQLPPSGCSTTPARGPSG